MKKQNKKYQKILQTDAALLLLWFFHTTRLKRKKTIFWNAVSIRLSEDGVNKLKIMIPVFYCIRVVWILQEIQLKNRRFNTINSANQSNNRVFLIWQFAFTVLLRQYDIDQYKTRNKILKSTASYLRNQSTDGFPGTGIHKKTPRNCCISQTELFYQAHKPACCPVFL